MKVVITEEEWYPVSMIETEIDEYNEKYAIEIDRALYERYEKCMEEFEAVQELLKERG